MNQKLQAHFTVTHEYEVRFVRNAFGIEASWFEDLKTKRPPIPKIIAFIDDGLHQAQPQLEKDVTHWLQRQHIDHPPPYIFPSGEEVKNNSDAFDAIVECLHHEGICRHSIILAIGGGAFLDACGFAASTVHRGVPIIRCPSTVLAQNDAGIGVKNSINAFGDKNYLGTFQPPFAVVNDSDLLATLPKRDRIAGLAEALKVAILKDPTFFNHLSRVEPATLIDDHPNRDAAIFRCAQLHLEHITGNGDPFESGQSRPLDFGHWAAHHLEGISNQGLRHGEAVAIGMAIDIEYAVLQSWLDTEVGHHIIQTFERLGLPTRSPLCQANLLKGLESFREHLGGKTCVTSIKGLGQPFDLHDIHLPSMQRAIEQRYTLS